MIKAFLGRMSVTIAEQLLDIKEPDWMHRGVFLASVQILQVLTFRCWDD